MALQRGDSIRHDPNPIESNLKRTFERTRDRDSQGNKLSPSEAWQRKESKALRRALRDASGGLKKLEDVTEDDIHSALYAAANSNCRYLSLFFGFLGYDKQAPIGRNVLLAHQAGLLFMQYILGPLMEYDVVGSVSTFVARDGARIGFLIPLHPFSSIPQASRTQAMAEIVTMFAGEQKALEGIE